MVEVVYKKGNSEDGLEAEGSLGRKNFKMRKHSEETKKKISLSMKGNRNYWNGRTRHPNFIYKAPGEKHWNWQGGKSSENSRLRKLPEYKSWREEVFRRDNWTCVLCFARGVKLQADHIKKFANFPELRFDVSNGRTLCIPCHRKTDTWGNRVPK